MARMILTIVALVCFSLAALNVPPATRLAVQWGWLGMFFLALALAVV